MKRSNIIQLTADDRKVLAKIGSYPEFADLKRITENTIYNLTLVAVTLTGEPVERTLNHEFIKGEIFALKRFIEEMESAVRKEQDDE